MSIKIFGKVRYHWQPDVAILIIYFIGHSDFCWSGFDGVNFRCRLLFCFLSSCSWFLLGWEFIVILPFMMNLANYHSQSLYSIKVRFPDIEKVEVTKDVNYLIFLKGRTAAGVFVCASGLRNILSMPWPLMSSILRVR